MNSVTIFAVRLMACALFLALPSLARADPSCLTYKSGVTTPTGFGSVLDGTTLLLDSTCTGSNVTLKVGSANAYVYKTYYVRSGSSWVASTFPSAGANDYVKGIASATAALAPGQTVLRYLAFVCMPKTGGYECGTGLTSSGVVGAWRLQQVTVSAEPEPGAFVAYQGKWWGLLAEAKVGNREVKAGHKWACPWLAENTDSLTGLQFNLRRDTAGAYSEPPGGKYRWRIYTDSGGSPGTNKLGETDVNGGKGQLLSSSRQDMGSKRRARWALLSPVPVTRGVRYWLVFEHVGTSSDGTSSLNGGRGLDPLPVGANPPQRGGPYFAQQGNWLLKRSTGGGWSQDEALHCGQMGMNAVSGHTYGQNPLYTPVLHIPISNTRYVRTRIRVPRSWSVYGHIVRTSYPNGQSPGPLVVSIRSSSGSLLKQDSVPRTEISQTNDSQTPTTTDPALWVYRTDVWAGSPLALSADQVVYLEYSCPSCSGSSGYEITGSQFRDAGDEDPGYVLPDATPYEAGETFAQTSSNAGDSWTNAGGRSDIGWEAGLRLAPPD